MNYTFKIIDTQRDDLTTLIERAEGGSVILEWMGGDKKDELTIVGSRLSFRMVGMSMEDGQYSDLFTGDETRYRVTMEDETGALIWQGFLLPDSYSEPYTNAPILVDFTATDGLGRLKGKYLPDDFYEEEKSVIEILSNCLKLTGLGLDFRFAPAIENHIQKDYNLIYLDTSLYIEKEKKQDAYKILNDLLESMVCTLYQADNYYNIEGLNIRNFRVYQAKVYDVDGIYIRTDEITRLLKEDLTVIATPYVTMQPPYGVVEVRHEREEFGFPETIDKEENDGWLVLKGVEDVIYPTDWKMRPWYPIYADADDGKMSLGIADSPAHNVSLKQQMYVQKGKKYRLELDFTLNVAEWVWDDEVKRNQIIADGLWIDPFTLSVKLNYIDADGVEQLDTLYTNFFAGEKDAGEITLDFEGEDHKANTIMFFTPVNSGLLDIDIRGFYESEGEESYIAGVTFEKVLLEEKAFEDTFLSEGGVEGYTLKKDITLEFADDAYGLSKAFRLQKLRTKGEYVEWDVQVYPPFERNGFWYSEFKFPLALAGANLVKDNMDEVYQTNKVEVLDVIYNFNGGQNHVIKTAEPLENNSPVPGDEDKYARFVTVRVYDLNAIRENRDYWEQWTDATTVIEKKRYCDTVKDIYGKLFDKPVHKVDYELLENIKFNDLLGWAFKDTSQWMLTNCRWNIDKGRTIITGIENYYGASGLTVEAGETIYFTGTSLNLNGAAYAPGGFIVSYKWEEVEGRVHERYIQSRNSPSSYVGRLAGDYYVFRLTVTDNLGNTASDTVEAFRTTEITLSAELIHEEKTFGDWRIERHYKINVTPELPAGASLNLKGRKYSKLEGEANESRGEAYIFGTGSFFSNNLTNSGGESTVEQEYSHVYYPGDNLVIEMISEIIDDPVHSDLRFTIATAEFVEGHGNVMGVPLELRINHNEFGEI